MKKVKKGNKRFALSEKIRGWELSYMQTATVEQVVSWEPCKRYTQKKIIKLFADRKSLSALDIIELNISAIDKLWTILREELIPANLLYEFACRCAESALTQARETDYKPDHRSSAAIDAKRKWMRGEMTDTGLAVAGKAAWTAADDIAHNLAGHVTWAVAVLTAKVATENIAREAAWSTVRNMSWIVNINEQIDTIREILINDKTQKSQKNGVGLHENSND